MREMEVRDGTPVVGQMIQEVFPPNRDNGVLAVSLTRGDLVSVPGPEDELFAGDQIAVVMPADRSGDVRRQFHDIEAGAENVVIAGGGTTALMLAQLLEGRNLDVTLIEGRRERCEALSRVLSHTHVIHGDATRLSVLEEERVERADVFVALCGSDEVNLMSTLQAMERGVPRTMVSVNRVDYVPLVERVGIDHAVSARLLTGNRIMALMGQAHITSVALLHGGKAEVVEVKAESGAPAVDRVIGEEVRFPKGSIIGALVRGEDMVVPRGGDIILPGDIVIAFALASVVDELGGMFSKPSAGS